MKCGPDNCPITTFSDLTPAEQKVERKRMAEKMHEQGFTQEAIAKQFGVDQRTIYRDLETFDTVSNVKGQGKDTLGRKKSTGRPKGSGRKDNARKQPKRPGMDKVQQAVADLVAAGKTVSRSKLAKEHGVGDHVVQLATAEARGAQKLLDILNVDPATLSLTAAAKLEVAKRMIERKHNIEYAARVRNLDEEVRQRVLKETKEYLTKVKAREEEADTTIARYREYTNNHKPLFTTDQYRTILMCLHPDGQRTAEKLSEAFRLFNAKKFQMTGEK